MMYNAEEAKRLEADSLAELAQLILYMQNQGKSCIKEVEVRKAIARIPATNRKREQCIGRTIDFLDKVIGVKVTGSQTVRGYRLFVGNALEMKREACNDAENCCYSSEDKAKYGLLIAILMLMYMMHSRGSHGYAISDSLLKNFLNQMGLINNGCFGTQTDLNKLLGATPTAEFISQGWLAYTKEVDGSGNDSIFYEWGPRAKALIDPMAILRAFCTMDGSTPQQWKSHYEEAQIAATRNN